MFTPNGELATSSAAKIKAFFRSLKLRVFLTVIIIGCLIGCAFFFITSAVILRHSVEKKSAQVYDRSEKIIRKMSTNVYTVYPAQATEIINELNILSVLYGGRIIVADSNLSIVYDSYGVEVGKVLVSTEALQGLRGVSFEYNDKENRKIEISLPIIDDNYAYSEGISESKYENIQGVFILSFTIEDCYEVAAYMQKVLVLVMLVILIVLFIFAVFASIRLAKPFATINESVKHVSAGYVDDKVELSGFSELDEFSSSFNDMLAALENVEASRQEFVSNVSHELKTPLTSMKVLADSLLAQEDAPVEMYREFMSDINSEIDRENKIITDLLSLVKLNRKSGDMHIAEVSINELIDLIVKRMLPIASASSVEIIVESYRDVIAEVDEVKLSLALTNLIENGIKYNKEKGTVKITLNSDHKYFLITVEDNGIGIPEDDIDRVFERFYRVDKMRSRQTGGTGLGLAITRSVVMMHHGIIKVESHEDVGTIFTIKIPLNFIPGT